MWQLKGEPSARHCVCSQVRGGVAESDGRLSAGDQIVKVNGEDMSHVTQEFAAALLKVIN